MYSLLLPLSLNVLIVASSTEENNRAGLSKYFPCNLMANIAYGNNPTKKFDTKIELEKYVFNCFKFFQNILFISFSQSDNKNGNNVHIRPQP